MCVRVWLKLKFYDAGMGSILVYDSATMSPDLPFPLLPKTPALITLPLGLFGAIQTNRAAELAGAETFNAWRGWPGRKMT